MTAPRAAGVGRAEREPGAVFVRARLGRRGLRARVAITPNSALDAPFLRPADLAEHLDLRLQLDAEALLHPAASVGHHREYVGGRRPAGVLDEVRVLRGEPGAAHRQAATARRVEQLACGAALSPRIVRVHERRAERLDSGRLGLLSPPP